MLIQVALMISVLLQFGAFIITISLIQKTKFNISWITISIGFFLMAIRRLIELIDMPNLVHNKQTLISSWIAVFISLLMFIAAIYIRQIFNLQDKINHLRKENEAKVLSAIIHTEEKERRKFAKEIHDGLGPILSAIKMAISAINKSELGKTNDQIIDKAEITVDNAIVSLREVSNNLNPHVLERFGLEKAIRTFTDAIITKDSLSFKLVSNLEGQRFSYNIEVILYRIVGELITNTLKHASASEIEISLFHDENRMELFYTDNGIGLQKTVNKIKGMGLLNIHSRVKSLDGDIEIYSKPNQGFYLKISLAI